MVKTIKDIIDMKKNGKKIAVLTSYDYALAALCDKAGVDILLVGDSAGMVILGYENTLSVTIEQMEIFVGAVSRAKKNSLVVGDLPFMSYQASISDAITNSGRLIKAGADAVKLEGGQPMADKVSAIVTMGIPVMGHIGFQPQTTALSHGYKIQGRTVEDGLRLIKDAKALEDAGVFSIVLEMVSHEVSKIISESISVPTIGIGSGVDCDGQVLVVHDILGLYEKLKPKFVKQYRSLSDEIVWAVSNYKKDVKKGKFPTEENWFPMEKDEHEKLKEKI